MPLFSPLHTFSRIDRGMFITFYTISRYVGPFKVPLKRYLSNGLKSVGNACPLPWRANTAVDGLLETILQYPPTHRPPSRKAASAPWYDCKNP